jgi:hypothetical protein
MANNISGKLPISRNIIYDSGNDKSTGRKRAGTDKNDIKFL